MVSKITPCKSFKSEKITTEGTNLIGTEEPPNIGDTSGITSMDAPLDTNTHDDDTCSS